MWFPLDQLHDREKTLSFDFDVSLNLITKQNVQIYCSFFKFDKFNCHNRAFNA